MPRIKVPFPKGGLDENPNYAEQNPNVSSKFVNVRTHDTIKGRERGGRRPGLSKFHPVQISGVSPIQRMQKSVRPQTYADTVIAAAFAISANHELVLVRTNGTTLHKWQRTTALIGASWDGTKFVYVNGIDNTEVAGKEGNVFRFNLDSETVPGTYTDWAFDTGVPDGNSSSILFSKENDHVYVGATPSTGWTGSGGVNANIWALDPDTGVVIWSQLLDTNRVDGLAVNSKNEIIAGTSEAVYKLNSTTGAILETYTHTTAGGQNFATLDIRSDDKIIFGVGFTTTTWDGTDGTAKNVFQLNDDFSLNVTPSNIGSLDPGNSHVRWIATDDDYVVNLDPGGTNTIVRFTAAGSSVWSFDTGSANKAWFDVIDSEEVLVLARRNNVWTGAGGANRNQWRLNGVTGAVISSADNGDMPPTDSPGNQSILFKGGLLTTRETSLIIAANGDIKKLALGGLTTPTNGVGAMTTELFRIQMIQSFEKVFMIDGVNAEYLDLSDNTVKDWATDVSSGTLPSLQRLLTRYRGRAIHAGSVADPNNYFMSKVGDFFNYEFSPATPTAIQAVAGNLSEAGLVGDLITAVIAMNDDALVFGCDQTIWLMAGDPAAGGSIDLISDDTGIAWDAWTKDPDNNIYFQGIDGIYRMRLGEQPENITLNRLDELFDAIDLSVNRILLAWDYRKKGLVVVVANAITGIAHQAFFYSARDDAWSTDTYTASIGPTALLAYDAEAADDKAMLFGCSDGFIRKIDETAKDDDGNTISSTVRYTPMSVSGGNDMRLRGILVILADGSKDVDIKIYQGQTAEQCATATIPRFKRALVAGRNEIDTRRTRAPWIQIELSQTAKREPWAVEAVFVDIDAGGKVRRHRL